MSCGVSHRLGLDLELLWLWHRQAAVASIRSLAWEPPYATGVALKKAKIVWKSLKELKIEPPHNLVILLLVMYPKKMQTLTRKGSCTPMFIVAIFTIAKA